MGFSWVGVQQFLDDKREERLIKEDRLAKRKDAVFNTMLPELAKRRAASKAFQKEQMMYQSWFKNRLSGGDLDEDTINAYTNIVSSNPEAAKTLISRIESIEEETNTRITGRDLISLSNVIEQTKPEDQSLEDWTSYAASQLTPRGDGSIDMDSTLERILSAGSESDLYDVQVDLMSTLSSPPSVSFQPDINRPSFLGQDPATSKAYRDQLTEASVAAYQKELDELNQAAVDNPAIEEDAEFNSRRTYLERLGNMKNPEGAILREYAPQIGPMFAEQDPGFARWYKTFSEQNTIPVGLQEALKMLEDDPSLVDFFVETYGFENLPEKYRGN